MPISVNFPVPPCRCYREHRHLYVARVFVLGFDRISPHRPLLSFSKPLLFHCQVFGGVCDPMSLINIAHGSMRKRLFTET